MNKRFIALLVVSGVFFSGASATDNIQEVAQRTWSDIYDAVSKAASDSLNSLADAANDVEKIAQQEMKKIGSRIDLCVTKHNSNVWITTLGDGSDVPGLALDGIKKLMQAIKPEHAAFSCIKIYKEIAHNVLKTMIDTIKEDIEKAEKPEDMAAILGKMLQSFMDASREKSLEFAVMQTALAKDVWLECEAAMVAVTQKIMATFHSELNTANFTRITQEEPYELGRIRIVLDKDALTDFMSEFMSDYLNGIVEAIAATLEQHYTIDRVALGLDIPEPLFC